MGEGSSIEWTENTFNPWWGCARISPACRNCYADRDARRWGQDLFHLNGPRRMMSDRYWQAPLKWNREAERIGLPARVFCASMADVFERHPGVIDARERLWRLIEQTPWLRWQLLTKRPENIAAMSPWGGSWPPHVWIGVSAEDQERADQRIPILLQVKASVRFLSCEPLLEDLDLHPYLTNRSAGTNPHPDAPDGAAVDGMERVGGQWVRIESLHWVIAGGESGPRARPTHPNWLRSLRRQCAEAGTDFFLKQWGEWAPADGLTARMRPQARRVLLRDQVDGLGQPVEMIRVGKKLAGALLDGRPHREIPPLTRTRVRTPSEGEPL
ncbi:DUF5131 family protein [Streptomyces sp. CA-106110]|uniref:DUF5131 family protein n=1 Tax=Streptomyces sp. CA-106110 TaxID=3240044 RepID=UPI003D90C501